MSMQEQTPRSTEVTNEDQLQDEQWVISSIKANATPPAAVTKHIHRVPRMVRDAGNYDKYYVPKVVSIGPYHAGNEKLELIEKLKPVFTMKLVSNEETLRSLYKKLSDPKMVQELRSFYAENSTAKFCNRDFTKMMLLDCCFILYYIQFIYGKKPEDCLELKSHQIVYLHHDLFLLENQIPFKVLNVAMELIKFDLSNKITPFINDNILVSHVKPRRKWTDAILCVRHARTIRVEQKMELIGDNEPNHLLHLLHRTLTKHQDVPKEDPRPPSYRCTFRNVNELADVGVHFKPSDTMSLAHVKYRKRSYCWVTADVELPPISVDDSTKRMLLNLIAYEMCSCEATAAWVTSYIGLLDSLIDHPEDVKALRKAGVLENSLGSDEEVAELFNEIGNDLVPNSFAYSDAKNKIQKHYESRRNSLLSELKREYVKSPWAFFALLGALIALFLSAVQSYYTVWGPEGECDELCKLLKTNHHL